MTSGRRLLVAGVGNLFRSDEAFGSEVIERLQADDWPPEVHLVDYGIGGIHLAFDLLEGCDLLILIDAVDGSGEPGEVTVVEIDRERLIRGHIEARSMEPPTVFSSVEALGGTLPRTLLVGCAPANDRIGMGLSPAVESAVADAADEVRRLLMTERERVTSDGSSDRTNREASDRDTRTSSAGAAATRRVTDWPHPTRRRAVRRRRQ